MCRQAIVIVGDVVCCGFGRTRQCRPSCIWTCSGAPCSLSSDGQGLSWRSPRVDDGPMPMTLEFVCLGLVVACLHRHCLQLPATHHRHGRRHRRHHHHYHRIYVAWLISTTHKNHIRTEWTKLDHAVIADSVHQWRCRLSGCVKAGGGHFEHCFWFRHCVFSNLTTTFLTVVDQSNTCTQIARPVWFNCSCDQNDFVLCNTWPLFNSQGKAGTLFSWGGLLLY